VAIVALLKRLWCFDSSHTTSEDLLRTQFALAENSRKVLVSSGLRYEDYLNSLQLEVEMRPAQKSDFARIAQLTQKSNQFNLSLHRRTLGEIEIFASTHSIWIVSARDRFGDSGVVGTALVELPKKAGGTVILDTFLLSCRALGRGVEETFLHGLGQVAARHQAVQVTAPYVAGPRNQPVREFFLRQKGSWNEPTSTFVAQTKDITPPPSHVQLKISSDAAQ
jgi:FkbH-like protein